MSQMSYSGFVGVKRGIVPSDASQVAALVMENFVINRLKGGLMKRPGSKEWSAVGDILGLGCYQKKNSSLRVPNTSHIVRHRRNGSTSTFEVYNWGTDAWDSITLGANTSFGTAGIAQFAQHNALFLVCGGRPAFLTDISSSPTFNRLGGPAPTTAPTWGTSGTGLTGSTMGFYTFYNPTTGWESSPSPITALTTISNKQIDWSALETTVAKEGVTKKRLYRTQLTGGGEPPFYRVAEINLATTTYGDTVADASLGAAGPDFGDHDPPPSTSYVCAEYEGRLWIASDYELYYSEPFDGNYYQLEYYSFDRVFRFPQRITGLAFSPDFGRLLVFLPPKAGIHFIAGRSESTFEQGIFNKEEGTNFPGSISIHEKMCFYWGQNGPTLITPSGIEATFGDDIKEEIRRFSTQEYNSDVNIFSLWANVGEEIQFFMSATDTGTALWEDVDSGVAIDWADAVTGATAEWSV